MMHQDIHARRGRFGGFGPGPGRGRGRGRGKLRAAVLGVLADQPRHGYEVMTELSERTGGFWKPSPGSIYPLLQQLQDEGLVSSQEEGAGRRVFSLTDTGRAWVAEQADEIASLWEGTSFQAGLVGMFDSFKQLGVATKQVANTKDEAQIEQARQVLDETRRRLYRILAGDEPGSSGSVR